MERGLSNQTLFFVEKIDYFRVMGGQKKITIAIDGFSACGKSTLAKALAKALYYVFIDSGSMYRCVALYAIENNLLDENKKPNEALISKQLESISINFIRIPDSYSNQVILNEKDVTERIRQSDVAAIVSEIAVFEQVRTYLVKQQQKLGEKGGIVMDGRDVGTVVFPKAELKLFVTADAEVRAQRRFLEQQAKGISESLDSIKANLAHRDELDLTRKIGPLKQADDAIVIDNTNLSEEQQLAMALNLVTEQINCLKTID